MPWCKTKILIECRLIAKFKETFTKDKRPLIWPFLILDKGYLIKYQLLDTIKTQSERFLNENIMYHLQLFKYGWLILKDGKDFFWGFGGKQIAIAVAEANDIFLTFENYEPAQKAA